MSLHAVKLLGINITISPKKEILEFLQKYIQKTDKGDGRGGKNYIKPLVIVTPNPEQVVLAYRNVHFADILNQADVALPDGVGITWALHQTSTNKQQGTTPAIPGVDFMENLVSEAANQRVPIALIGGRGNLAARTFDCLQKKYSRPSQKLEGWAVDAPEIRFKNYDLRFKNKNQNVDIEEDILKSRFLNLKSPGKQEELYFRQLAQRITDSGVGIVFVGLGAPKQEYFIDILKSYFLNLKSPIIFMSVGGSFDEISARLPKPPDVVKMLGLKWLWRLMLEPWRIGRQRALIHFLFLVLQEKRTLRGIMRV